MQLNVKNAKGLTAVIVLAAIAVAVVFAMGKNALALVILAVSVVGYLIFTIGKSGLPGAEPEAEQEQREETKKVEEAREKDQVPPPQRDFIPPRPPGPSGASPSADSRGNPRGRP